MPSEQTNVPAFEPVALTPSNPSFLPLPQTAADLLEALLRSQLFAESIRRQIHKQSRPFLKHAAQEYAAALVQRKVLTSWQASELLSGRVRFYAGTFRLLGRWTTDPGFPLFLAEQSGAQRLVLLEAIPRLPSQDTAVRRTPDGIGVTPMAQPQMRHPHVARCLQVQTTATHRLNAYEFHEALGLSDAVSRHAPKRPHSAHLIIQLAETLPAFSRETLESFDPQRAVIDHEGHLRWLTGPRTLVHNGSGEGPSDDSSGSSCQELQLVVIHKFASWLGQHPELSCCSNLAEVISTLRPIAEPWIEAFPKEGIPGSRAVLNRMLRKGPSLKQIEAFHAELQHALIPPQTQPPLQLTPPTEHTARESQEHSTSHSQRPQRRRKRSISCNRAPRLTSGRVAASPEHPSARTAPPAPQIDLGWAGSLIRTQIQSRRRQLTAVIAAILTGMVTMQWIWRWSVPEAKAQTEARPQSGHSSGNSR